jgi:hypothetical protein
MNLLNILLDDQNAPAIGQLAKNFGLSETSARQAVAQMAPALTRGMQRNIGNPQGLESLMGALNSGNHQRYVDRPETLGDADTLADGNAILGHLFGSKDISRRVASNASANTGLDDGLLKKMLPVVASMMMGTMSKQAAAGSSTGAAQARGFLQQLLDSDDDGSVLDDVLGMAGRFLR